MQTLRHAILLGMALTALAACEARSISNSGYQPQPAYGYNARNTFYYQGELSAYDVLGGDARTGVSDADIAQALAAKQPIALKPRANVMLVQSGAIFADAEMIAAMQKHYRVSSFTGVPWIVARVSRWRPPSRRRSLRRLSGGPWSARCGQRRTRPAGLPRGPLPELRRP